MKLVGYLYKKVFPLFIGATIFFSLVLNLVDLFIHIAVYLQNECAAKDILQVMIYYTPKTLWYAIPVGILFSTSYTLSDMYAHNELEALFASGVSLFRFTAPLLLIAAFFSLGLFVFENKVVVQTYEKKVALQDDLLGKSVSKNNSDVIVLSDNGKIIYKAKRYNEQAKRLQGLYLIFRNEDKQLEAIIYANTATWNEELNRWILSGSTEYLPEGETVITHTVESKYTDLLTESYEIFRKTVVDVQSVNTTDAKIYIDHLKKAGLPFQEQLSEYYKKFSFPWIVFIVVILSVGLTGKTKKNVLLISLASCISSAVLFYVMMMVTMVLAKHGYISAFSGAWFPVIFFTVVSGILIKYSRT